MIGTSISHYRIIDQLGKGGMGVVYRAEDTNLKRQVAIKVLPDIFSARSYDLSSDSQRFLMVREEGIAAQASDRDDPRAKLVRGTQATGR